MILDLTQAGWDECGSLSLRDMKIIAAIAESEDKRLSLRGICRALGCPEVTRGEGSSGYTTIRWCCVKMWEDGLLRRFERRKLGKRRKKRMEVVKFSSAFWSLSDEGWLLLSRLRSYDPEHITEWIAKDEPEKP